MNRTLACVVALALLLFSSVANAQQYIYPMYSQNDDVREIHAYPLTYVAPVYGNADYEAANHPAPYPTVQSSSTLSMAGPVNYSRSANWTGCYLGGFGGGAWGGNSQASGLYSQSSSSSYNGGYDYGNYDNGGYIVGGTLGCNIEFSRSTNESYLFGIEGEGGGLGVRGNRTDPYYGGGYGQTRDKTTLGDLYGILAGRLGVAFDRGLVYGKFGAVLTSARSNIGDACSSSCYGSFSASGHQRLLDPALGGGVEYALTNTWSLKGEYMYLDTTDKYQVCGAGGGAAYGSNFCSQHNLFGAHTVKVGLNYHFNDMETGHGSHW